MHTYYDSGTSNWYVDSNKTGTPVSNDDLREYLAGAYYKIDPNLEEDIVLPNSFAGISSDVADSKYVFRGVIDGSGMTIVNPTNQPFIMSSNGCVIKNVTFDVQPSAGKAITQSDSAPFAMTGTFGTERCETYGAVIGQIFGGDNIIDSVSVKFTGIIVDAASASKAQYVPIGGYVGVVINGGLIFRGMNGLSANNQAGLSASNLTGFGTGVGDSPTNPLASDNTKWLYVNPIIGRVLNGYAITESSSYKPFEDGKRTYPDGSGIIFNGLGYSEVADMSSFSGSAVGVTMRNGTKNYSITDIKTDAADFTMMKNGVTSTFQRDR